MTEITVESRPCNVMAMYCKLAIACQFYVMELNSLHLEASEWRRIVSASWDSPCCLLIMFNIACMLLNENFQTYQSLKTAPIYK